MVQAMNRTGRRSMTLRRMRRTLACTLAALLVAVTARAETDPRDQSDLWDYLGARPFRLTASSGIDFSRGDYGTGTRSDVLYVPSALKVELEPLVFKVTVPWVRVDGDVVLIGDQPVGVAAGGAPARSGVGDVVVSLGYVYYPDVDFLPLTELTGKVKIPTADQQQGLGTGEADYTLQLDLSKSFGPITPFGGGGYKFVGEPPNVSFRDKAFAYGGFTLRLSRAFTIGAAYDWSQSAVATRGDDHELSPFVTIKLGRHLALDPYGVVGLSQNAPDWGVGLQVRFIYDRD